MVNILYGKRHGMGGFVPPYPMTILFLRGWKAIIVCWVSCCDNGSGSEDDEYNDWQPDLTFFFVTLSVILSMICMKTDCLSMMENPWPAEALTVIHLIVYYMWPLILYQPKQHAV